MLGLHHPYGLCLCGGRSDYLPCRRQFYFRTLPAEETGDPVPSPNVAEDHQTKNALALVGKDAAVMVADKDAEQQLVPKALEIIHDDERLRVLGRNIATLAQHQSAERIVDEIVKIIEKKNL